MVKNIYIYIPKMLEHQITNVPTFFETYKYKNF